VSSLQQIIDLMGRLTTTDEKAFRRTLEIRKATSLGVEHLFSTQPTEVLSALEYVNNRHLFISAYMAKMCASATISFFTGKSQHYNCPVGTAKIQWADVVALLKMHQKESKYRQPTTEELKLLSFAESLVHPANGTMGVRRYQKPNPGTHPLGLGAVGQFFSATQKQTGMRPIEDYLQHASTVQPISALGLELGALLVFRKDENIAFGEVQDISGPGVTVKLFEVCEEDRTYQLTRNILHVTKQQMIGQWRVFGLYSKVVTISEQQMRVVVEAERCGAYTQSDHILNEVCNLCEEVLDEGLLYCRNCSAGFHAGCVDSSDDITANGFICGDCMEKIDSEDHTHRENLIKRRQERKQPAVGQRKRVPSEKKLLSKGKG
jgi:hypothetical protein